MVNNNMFLLLNAIAVNTTWYMTAKMRNDRYIDISMYLAGRSICCLRILIMAYIYDSNAKIRIADTIDIAKKTNEDRLYFFSSSVILFSEYEKDERDSCCVNGASGC